MKKKFYFNRKPRTFFTVGELIKQINKWSRKNFSVPELIYLPVEEYYNLAIILKISVNDFNFMGIPVRIEYTKQEESFNE